jgi:hypothetical protein
LHNFAAACEEHEEGYLSVDDINMCALSYVRMHEILTVSYNGVNDKLIYYINT